MARDEGTLEILCRWLEAQDLEKKDMDRIVEGQPLRLKLVRRLLEAAGHPDREFFREVEEGLPLSVAEDATCLRGAATMALDNHPWEPGLRWVPNYSSVEEHVDFASAKFEEDIAEGLMLKMSLRDFKAKYGEHRLGFCQKGYEEGYCRSRAPCYPHRGEALGPRGTDTRVAIKGYTDNQSNESLLKKFMTSKFPSTLILLEFAEELTAKCCELKLHWLRRDENQLVNDLTNQKFDSFDKEFRVPLKGADIQWRILDKLTESAEGFYQELKARKEEGRAKPPRFKKLPW